MTGLRRNGATIKRERIQRIRSLLLKDGMLPTSLSKFIAWCEIHIGLSHGTVRNYINSLVIVEDIEIDESNDMILKGKANETG